MASLPIPEFHSIHEKPVIEYDSVGDRKTIGFIALDPMAGKRHRYSVLRVHCKDGKIRCIGRELDLETARRIVKRPSNLDGRPLVGY